MNRAFDPANGGLDRAEQLLRSGQLPKALGLLEQLRGQFPDNEAVLRLSGMALSMAGQHELALVVLSKRLELNPSDAGACIDLANVQINLGQSAEALALLEPLAGKNREPAFLYNLARAYKGVGRTAEAVEPLDELLAQHPGHAGAKMTLADVYKALGEADKAAALLRQLITTTPTNAVAWWSLSNLKSGGFSKQELKILEELAARPKPPEHQLYLEFALGSALEQSGQNAEAFVHYATGNRLKRREKPWDRKGFRKWLADLRAGFDGLEFPERAGTGKGPRPVFIVSLPRSGSTLTEQILSAHPDVTAADELPWIPRLMAEASREQGRNLADWAAQADDADWLALGQRYLEYTTRWHGQTPVFTDKLPGNIPFVPALLKMLPQALVINVTRTATDVCWSCYRQLFISGSEFAYDLDDLAAYWWDHQRYLSHWESIAPHRIRTLSYENLVENPEAEIRQLLEFLGLPWDERCLEFHTVQRAVNTASASQVREKINRRGLGHWKKFEKQLAPLVEALEREEMASVQ